VIPAAKGVQDDFACAYTPILDRLPWWIYIGRDVYLGEDDAGRMRRIEARLEMNRIKRA
jgi:hypothetical protein